MKYKQLSDLALLLCATPAPGGICKDSERISPWWHLAFESNSLLTAGNNNNVSESQALALPLVSWALNRNSAWSQQAEHPRFLVGASCAEANSQPVSRSAVAREEMVAGQPGHKSGVIQSITRTLITAISMCFNCFDIISQNAAL